jgi:two-component system CheB/CheR fusion protein
MTPIRSYSLTPDCGPQALVELPQLPFRSVASNTNPRHQQCEEVETICVIDDDEEVLEAVGDALMDEGYAVELFTDCRSFLHTYDQTRQRCILVDAVMSGMSGTELVVYLRNAGGEIPIIVMTGHASVAMAVEAMKAGAMDLIEKPFQLGVLLASLRLALTRGSAEASRTHLHNDAAKSIASLTSRQHQVLELVVAGHPSKNIAADLGISQRTVDNHRAAITRKTGASSLPHLIRTALAAQ